jgi:hypothetical protein
MAIAAPPVAAGETYWGWLVARHPTTTNYTPAAVDQGNSQGFLNTVTRDSIGRYSVDLGDLASYGIVQVSALAGQPRYCAVVDWGFSGADEFPLIECFDRQGNLKDSAFVVSFLSTAVTSGKLAFLYANDSTSSSYTPDFHYAFNTTGNTNAVQRDGTGSYRAFFPGFTQNRGTVLVSAQGGSAIGCRAVSWSTQQSAMVVRIKCYDDAGLPTDAHYFVSFMQGLGIKGAGGTHTAYLWANHPTTASYHPNAAFRFSTAGLASTVRRTGLGTYVVDLPGLPTGGAALVTPTGIGKAHCNVTSIRFFGTPQHVGVRCFGPSGGAVDAPFALSYAR